MSKRSGREKTKFLAKLVTENQKPCAFCKREVDDEIIYGKLYAIGDIQCHYFCVLLSCCLVQKGKDEEGLFGFLYHDILAEVERSKKHRCSYCGKDGATLGCCVSQCRKQFHLPCGRERNAVSLFYGTYKSFCKNHAPKQKVTDNVMAKARQRMRMNRKSGKPVIIKECPDDEDLKAETVCVICYEEVDCFPTADTFWPPCCARDAWFHRSCVQRMSLSAGMHYLKCPLCNGKENFYQAVLSQGFYVPDRDAAWELEQNAFAEIYERELRCGLEACSCPSGRDHDNDTGPWDIKLCLLCGGSGAHAQCLLEAGCAQTRYVCATCIPAAPEDLDKLASSIENVILSEQTRAQVNSSGRRIMPSRMSLRRTKQRQERAIPSSSSQSNNQTKQETSNTSISRVDLNLKTPRRSSKEPPTARQGSSPGKLLQALRHKASRPAPLSEKNKIENIFTDLVNNMLKEKSKVKELIRAWSSPKKECVQDIQQDVQEDENPSEKEDLDIKQELLDSHRKSPENTQTNECIKSEDNTDCMIQPQNIETICIDTDVDETIHSVKKSKENDINITPTNKLNETNCIKEESDETKELNTEVIDDDDSSRSTFCLPPEFIAEDSDNPIFDTPKKLKTVEIQKNSSMEISENNDIVNIDLVEIKNAEKRDFLKNLNIPSPEVKEKCSLKFGPRDKEPLETNKMDIDIESFKNQYLNEVDRGFQCNFSHKNKHQNNERKFKLRTAIDFAIDATKTENRGRKVKNTKKKARKRKLSGIVLKYENIENKKRKKDKTEVSIRNENMRVKISLKKQNFRLKIMQSNVESSPKNLKQYVLKCSDGKSNEIIGKPEKDVTPIKRKYIKQEKSPDNLVQTSIQSFFKGKSKE